MRCCRLSATLAVLVAVGISTSWAGEVYSYHCLAGCPTGAPTDELVVREIYILSNNRTTKFADWVAYRITADPIGSTRTRVWRADPALPGTSTLEPDGLHRGARRAPDGPRPPGPARQLHGHGALGGYQLPIQHHAAEVRSQSGPVEPARRRGSNPCPAGGGGSGLRHDRAALREPTTSVAPGG